MSELNLDPPSASIGWISTSANQPRKTSELRLTISLSLTTINSIYLVSVCTEGLRTNLLDLLRLPACCCCVLVWPGASSSPVPTSSSLSSSQSAHSSSVVIRLEGKKVRSTWSKIIRFVGFKNLGNVGKVWHQASCGLSARHPPENRANS